jgi:hypothetical protein
MRAARLGLLLAGVLASGCGSSTTPSTTPTTTDTTTTTTPNFTLALTGPSLLTGLRQRSQVTATITLDDASTQDVTKTTTWTSSNAAVAVVTPAGVITTITPGATRIIGTYQTTTNSVDLQVAPITTTFQGTLASSDGRNGTFTIIVNGAVAPTATAVSAVVSGSVQIPGSAVTVTGFFESATGALTLSGAEAPYRFSGTVIDAVLTGSFIGPDGVTGVIISKTTTER